MEDRRWRAAWRQPAGGVNWSARVHSVERGPSTQYPVPSTDDRGWRAAWFVCGGIRRFDSSGLFRVKADAAIFGP
jgi:hypothetical protein